MIKSLITAAALSLAALPALAKTPVPVASGPLPQSEASHAFGGAGYTLRPEDLKANGYVEEEFFITGKANVYDWQPDGAVVRSANVPYTTRVLVRRPISAAKFSGRVVVEPMNPSNLFDLNIGWAIHNAEFVRNGDAWVGFTAKPIAVQTLKTFDPARYAALDWGNPLSPSDPRNCVQRAGGDSTQATENGLVWDITTQVGAWIRSDEAKNPFRYGGRLSRAKWLYGWGYSQTGGFFYTYVNAIHPLVVKEDGKSMFDGYSIAMLTGPSAINQCAPTLPAGDPRRVIGAVGVPVMHIMSQSDYLGFVPQRRADGNTPGDRYRHYDNSGSGHATPDELYYAARPADIIKGGRMPPPVDCNEGPRSRYPSSVPFNAEIHMLYDWTEKGVAPIPSQYVTVSGNPPQPVLDKNGNVQGGMRSPFLDVPVSSFAGNSTGASFCRIAGHETKFNAAKLESLYPTHEAYVSAVEKNVADLVAKRMIVKADGDALIKEAKAAKVP